MLLLGTRVLLAFAFAIAASGCTHSLTAEHKTPPPAPITIVAVGAIGADGKDRQREVRLFRRMLMAELEETEAFDQVISVPPMPLPPNAVLVTGRFRTMSDGDEGLRYLIGYGMGAPRLRATFEIHDAGGQRLAAFSQSSRSYAGSGSTGHWNPVYLEDVVKTFAHRTAEAVVRWSKGEDMEPWLWERVPGL